MNRILAITALPLVTSGLLVLGTSAAQADDRVCRGFVGAVSVDDNVVVPSGATCRLVGTRVEGNVEVRGQGRLFAVGVQVDGNIQAQGAARVVVKERGSVPSRIEGNIQLDRGLTGVVRRTVVDGDIQLFGNRGRFVVRRTVVDGNLQCQGNRPAPVGGANRVSGDKEGQCRRL